MSKSTVAVILTSPARLGPWGDDAWRFTGAMQLVSDGPDHLHAEWTVPGRSPAAEASGGADSRLVSMVLRDDPVHRAADIAVMALALLRAPNWSSLAAWWQGPEKRIALEPQLQEIVGSNAGEFKLAVIETQSGSVPDEVVASLRERGFEVVRFDESR